MDTSLDSYKTSALVHNCRGFVQPQLLVAGALGAGLIILGLGIALKVQTARLDSCKAEYAAFVAQVKVLGEKAEREAKAKETADLKAKEKADAKHKTGIARLNAELERLRDDNARRGVLPKPRADSTSPQRACFDRPELDSALRGFIGETAQLIREGAEAVDDLDTAKAWARDVQSSPR